MLEAEGLPTAVVTAIPAIHQAFRTPRIVVGRSVQYPLGDPACSPEEEAALRLKICRTALAALSATPDGPELFRTA